MPNPLLAVSVCNVPVDVETLGYFDAQEHFKNRDDDDDDGTTE